MPEGLASAAVAASCPDPSRVAARDLDSASWVRRLSGQGAEREEATRELHAMLLRFARARVNARGAAFNVYGAEADDVAHEAAADALVAINAKLSTFRGESRFSTWAYKFVVLEVAHKLGRHYWRDGRPSLADAQWTALPDRFGLHPEAESEWRDLLAALRRAVETELTPHQRMLFVAIVLNQVPLDALVVRLDSNRNAIYKALFDARRKLRAVLVANGYLNPGERAAQ